MTDATGTISTTAEQDKPPAGGFRNWWQTHVFSRKKPGEAGWRGINRNLGYLLEILIIVLWALFVGRAYLNLDPKIWPIGMEFPSSFENNYIWTNLSKCGTCIFWNGFSHGGAPAFADLFGSMLYPFVVIFTLIAGPLGGAKLSLVFALIIAGIAQWWLAKVMGFGWVARLWSGLLALAGGQLAGRMELGTFGLVISTAASSLVIAPGVALGLTGKRRYAILLGVTLGMALLSGQGYLQFGLVLCIIPAFLVFILRPPQAFKRLWKEYLLAGGLAILFAGVFIIPMIHFYPNVVKPEDSLFKSAQALRFIPLNHLIDDLAFYGSNALKPNPYGYLYVNFLGWVPILLAILAWRFIPKSGLRLLLFFVVAIILVYLNASADIIKLLYKISPIFAGIRHVPVIAGLANPLILGLSAWGLDALVRLKINWPRVGFIISERARYIRLSFIFFLILAIPLIWSLVEAYNFGHNWILNSKTDPKLYQQATYLSTSSSEWVNVVFGEHLWIIPGFGANLKISNAVRTWSWKDRIDPPVNQEVTRNAVDPTTPNLVRSEDGLYFLSHPENEYAFIQNGNKKITCKAKAIGGSIDVTCPDSPGGQLIVYENNWTGWYAWMDQKPAALRNADWLSMNVPAGKHTFQFRYRPWDVWVGMFLSLVGVAFSIVLWFRVKETKVLPSEI